jgi:hypothetical protein
MSLLQRLPNRLWHIHTHDARNVLPVFRNQEHAHHFRDHILMRTNTRAYRWVVSLDHNTNEAFFQTRAYPEMSYDTVTSVTFDFGIVDELLDRKIGCVMVEHYSLNNDILTIQGMLWN